MMTQRTEAESLKTSQEVKAIKPITILRKLSLKKLPTLITSDYLFCSAACGFMLAGLSLNSLLNCCLFICSSKA